MTADSKVKEHVHLPQKPSIGRIVHYFAYGTPGGEYATGEPKAAIITAIRAHTVDLCVLNPTGMFFNQGVIQGDRPGCWNWPPRV